MSNKSPWRLSRRSLLWAAAAGGLAAGGSVIGGSAVPPATAQASLTPQQALERLFSASQADASSFAPSFLAQVSITETQTIIDQLESSLGAYQSVQQASSGYSVVFAQGSVPINAVALDDQGRFTSLLLGSPQFTNAAQGLDQSVAALQALAGKVSLLVLRNGDQVVAVAPDAPLAVGSSFKLAVLTALNGQIQVGQHAWDEVVQLQSQWKSLPSGILQTWPDGSPLTLQTLASLMISMSDNTAADSLIAIVGRDAVETVAPVRDQPFLTTREAFVLKDPANADLRQQYLSSDPAQKLVALQQADTLPLPAVSTLTNGGPIAPEVEWFFTTGELCSLMAGVADLPLMAINPGVADASQWAQVAYKGGSEPGVINLTYGLQNATGESFCVSATWNNDTTDDNQFGLLVGQLLSALAGGGASTAWDSARLRL